MKCVHETVMYAKCPKDAASVEYEVKVTLDHFELCEDIVKVCSEIGSGEAIYQEALTQKLADTFDAEVVTVARHRHGTKLTVTCEPQ